MRADRRRQASGRRAARAVSTSRLDFRRFGISAAPAGAAKLALIAVDRLIDRLGLGPARGGVVEIDARLRATSDDTCHSANLRSDTWPARAERTRSCRCRGPAFLAPTHGAHSSASSLVAAAAAHDARGVPFDGREQAVADLALGRQPQAVAVAAERLRDRVDEADAAAAVDDSDSRWPAGWDPIRHRVERANLRLR